MRLRDEYGLEEDPNWLFWEQYMKKENDQNKSFWTYLGTFLSNLGITLLTLLPALIMVYPTYEKGNQRNTALYIMLLVLLLVLIGYDAKKCGPPIRY